MLAKIISKKLESTSKWMLRADPPGIIFYVCNCLKIWCISLSAFLFAEEGVVECTVQTETAVLHPEITKLQKESVVVQAAANMLHKG